MPGQVLSLDCAVGDIVEQGQALAVLEAMKLETIVRAPQDGKVTEVTVKTGDRVGPGDLLFRVEG